MAASSVDLVNSQIDVGSIVSNLIYVDSAPVRRMQSQVSTLQSKISAFQTLNTRLSTLSDKVDKILYGSSTEPLNHPYSYADRLAKSAFSRCNVTSSNESAISAIADNAQIGGNYSVRVTDLAEAESWASGNFAATTTETGVGILKIVKADNTTVDVTINEDNNTLTGVCNAINEVNAGVTASIINDGTPGTPYKLLITATDSGSDNSFSIDESGLTGQALGTVQKQAATDAVFVVNGVTISKGSNTVSDVIPGITFTLKEETTSSVRLSVGKDVNAIVSALDEFVSAYNTVNSYINSQFAYDSTNKKSGLLSGDSNIRNIQSNLQTQMVQSISNRFTDFNVAGQVGIEFNRDGSLSLNDTKLRDALASNFTGVAALFLGNGTPANNVTASDSRVAFNSKTAATQAGTYSVEITALAQKASAIGSQAMTGALTGAETLTVTPNGGSSFDITLAEGAGISDVLLAINNAFTANGMDAAATNDGTNKILISADNYGSAGSFTIVSQKGIASETGFGSLVTATGTDISGLINGHAAVGSGTSLTGAIGQSEEGLMLNISQTAIGNYGTATVAPADKGIEDKSILMNLHSLLEGITDPLSGPIHNSEDALSQNIKYLNEEIASYQMRLDIQKEILTMQFNKADEALKLLQVSQSSLSSQLAKLG